MLIEHQSDSAMEMSSPSQELYKDGVLTLGCIGKRGEPCSQIEWKFLRMFPKQNLDK